MPLRNSSSSSLHGRILLVDDNVSGSNARKTVLEEFGHKISVASSGADALEQFAQHKYDLVVTDYKMPRMDGLELIVRQPARGVLPAAGQSIEVGIDPDAIHVF